MTSERINLGTAFTSRVLDSKIIIIRIVGPHGKDKIEWVFWFSPFERGVWLVFIAQITVSGFTYQFLDFIGRPRQKIFLAEDSQQPAQVVFVLFWYVLSGSNKFCCPSIYNLKLYMAYFESN
jgi:hypothetical protein